jgi:hypothetical protein
VKDEVIEGWRRRASGDGRREDEETREQVQESEREMRGVIEIVKDRTKQVLVQAVRGTDDSQQQFCTGINF